MKITGVKTYVVSPGKRNYIYVRIDTDEGIHGIGEAYSVGPDLATAETIKYFADWLIGQDPTRPEYIWTMLFNYSRFPGGSIVNSAISGIDFALWDITAKALGVPVYKLFGGPSRDKVWIYEDTHAPTAEALVEEVQQLRSEGYTAMKLFQSISGRQSANETIKAMREKYEKLRSDVGYDFELGIDFQARNFEPFRALWYADAIKEFRPFFIEEPIRPDNFAQMAELKKKLPAPLATGECLYTKYEFNDLIAMDAADILQPDIMLTGGMTEGKKIAAMAEANYKVIAPHNPLSPLSTVQNVHFAASIPNFLILEHKCDDRPDRRDILNEYLPVKDGYIELPTRPGWGVDLNYEYLDSLSYAPWHRTFALRVDGSIDMA